MSQKSNPAEKLQRKNEHIAPMLHFKRMGRELAMQYLFQCDLAGNDNLSESLENFWTQAEESGEFPLEPYLPQGTQLRGKNHCRGV